MDIFVKKIPAFFAYVNGFLWTLLDNRQEKTRYF